MKINKKVANIVIVIKTDDILKVVLETGKFCYIIFEDNKFILKEKL